MNEIQIGDVVTWVDPVSRPHAALVTAIWLAYSPADPLTPGLNLVLVSGDPAREDIYGRQIEREASVVHVSKQSAPGAYWCRIEEYDAERDHALRAG